MKKYSDDELRNTLTKEQYDIIVNKGTEAPFSGKLLQNKKNGLYRCVVCKHPLFDSNTKFDSGSGWPSFYDVVENNAVELNEDTSHGMERVEVTCANCGAHLGHLFKDAPAQPTGNRFCINSASLDFVRKK